MQSNDQTHQIINEKLEVKKDITAKNLAIDDSVIINNNLDVEEEYEINEDI